MPDHQISIKGSLKYRVKHCIVLLQENPWSVLFFIYNKFTNYLSIILAVQTRIRGKYYVPESLKVCDSFKNNFAASRIIR